jgi:hypothetical protein
MIHIHTHACVCVCVCVAWCLRWTKARVGGRGLEEYEIMSDVLQ